MKNKQTFSQVIAFLTDTQGVGRMAKTRGRLSMVEVLVLTSSDQLLLMLKKYFFTFFTQTSYPNEEVNCIKPSSSVEIS